MKLFDFIVYYVQLFLLLAAAYMLLHGISYECNRNDSDDLFDSENGYVTYNYNCV